MSIISDTFQSITGQGGKNAARRSANIQAAAGEDAIQRLEQGTQEAQGYLSPFQGLIDKSVGAASFLANPQEQFNFLQDNPLFQMSLDEAGRQTKGIAAASGRLSAGDTLQQLANNVLLTSSPLIDRQRQDIGNLLNMGTGLARTQGNLALGEATGVGNLMTDVGAVRGAGEVGQANALAKGTENLLNLATTAYGMSDSRLKENITNQGQRNGHDWHEWDWNKEAGSRYGLYGREEGVMAHKVKETRPDCVKVDADGFMSVDYEKLGVRNGA